VGARSKQKGSAVPTIDASSREIFNPTSQFTHGIRAAAAGRVESRAVIEKLRQNICVQHIVIACGDMVMFSRLSRLAVEPGDGQ
jgi:hypothetical protein